MLMIRAILRGLLGDLQRVDFLVFSSTTLRDADFLLDGLHEDVNLVKKKPYVENRESDGADPDQEVAGLMWKTTVSATSRW